MSDRHEHHHHDHGHGQEHPHPETQVQDAGTQALAEALHSSFAIVKVVMALMVVAFFCSGFFTVGPSEKAVILRFGKPVGEGSKALLGSGWHWAWPYPIDEVVRIPITEQQTVRSTIGWYFTTPEQELSGEEFPAGASLDPARDGYVLTADRNIIHSRAVLYYHINDPIQYVFNFASASNTIQNALNNSLLYTAAHFKVDDALYNDQAGFQDAVLHHVSDLIERAQLGIVIDQCVLHGMIPPRQLKSEFDQVIAARENRNKTITEAQGKANDIVLSAGARAAGVVNEAQSARIRYVTSVNADASTFTNLLAKYQANPNLFAQQFFIPAIGNVLTNADKWFLPQRADGKPRELRLQLNREPPQPKSK